MEKDKLLVDRDFLDDRGHEVKLEQRTNGMNSVEYAIMPFPISITCCVH